MINYIIIAALFGLIIGSFLNCFIWRLYKDETLSGRSYCPKCRKQISWYDNIPVLSFFILGGRCRRCKQAISWQYPLVEIICAILFAVFFWKDAFSPHLSLVLVRDWLLISSLIVIFVYDLRWQMIPMLIVWPMLGFIFILNLLLGILWWKLFLFAAIGFLFFGLQYYFTKGKGIGSGDIWLGVLLGLIFPDFSLFFLTLFSAYVVGSIISLFLLINKKKGWKSKVPLGPFLIIGAIITLIWGQQIIEWYLGLF